jgi:bacterioferritin
MASREQIVNELTVSYRMELETIINYLANSINLDGVRAEEISKALAADVASEMVHAQRLGKRIKTLGGTVPGSLNMEWDQTYLQPPSASTDVVSVIKGVIEAEDRACRQYARIIEMCDGQDYVTQDVCITLLGEEEEHRREFIGFLKEYAR